MDLTRREFSHGALAAALAWAAARPLVTSAGESRRGGSKATSETKTFHFDLSHGGADALYVLRIGGRRYRVDRHTADTRRTARLTQRGLRNVPDTFLTHFAAGVVVSARGVQRMHVTLHDPVHGPGLALVAMHIPTDARRNARRARHLSTPVTATGDVCTLQDQVEDDFLTGWSTAKAIITHHPDLCTTDPDTAAVIEMHMDGDHAAEVNNLALAICSQGPAYEHDPAYEDGWCVLVPMVNGDGSPLLDTTGEQIFDYQFTDPTEPR